MLDPNLCPGLIKDAERDRVWLERLIAQADIVKVSDEDLYWIKPEPFSLCDRARALLELDA